MSSKENRRQLKEEYRQMRPDMGIIMFKCIPTGRAYLCASQNVKAKMNSASFQLKHGSNFNKAMQADWNAHGEDGFVIEVIEKLEYEKEESAATDYGAFLKLMLEEWLLKMENAQEIV